jgi:hypothetical protein
VKYVFTEPRLEDGVLSWGEGFVYDSLAESVSASWVKELKYTMIDTREQYIREGLIRLGWTPPPEEKKECV